MRLPSPPRTPVSSVASSFLSFSPDAPRTPSCTSPLSPSPLFDDTTPKARRQALFNAVSRPKIIKLEAPPKRKNRLVGDRDASCAPSPSIPGEQNKDDSPTSVRSFGSRNPFASLIAAESSSEAPCSSTSAYSSSLASPVPSSLSSLSLDEVGGKNPRLVSGIVVNDGDGQSRRHQSKSGNDGAGRQSTTSETLDEGDISSAWEDELYSSLSEASPLSPAFPPVTPPFATPAASPGLLHSKCDPAASRSARRPSLPSPRHPYRRTASSARHPPSPRRPRPQRQGSSSKTLRATSLAPHSVSEASSPDCPSFSFDPTSPVQPSPAPRRFAFLASSARFKAIVKTSPTSAPLNASSTAPPPDSSAKPLASSPSAAFSAFEAKLARRAAARTARRAQAEAEEARLRLGSSRRLKTLEGFDVEELDRFFGVTPRRAKALRGGYEREAVAAGLLNGGSPQREEDKWRSASTEFRELLGSELDSDAGDDDDALLVEDELDDDDGNSALGACICLAAPIVLTPTRPTLLDSRSASPAPLLH
ncbi:uncharacterized protein JCM10292_006940 [Rhodotorula paludigena]|uniref:uncharacterized protein n=1 Tax=Rhodotorula paludigena TaxID=86838 RepID=UPI0031808CEB